MKELLAHQNVLERLDITVAYNLMCFPCMSYLSREIRGGGSGMNCGNYITRGKETDKIRIKILIALHKKCC